uniref:Uncharacterized protein n=1 Tax=Glossina pallidipes TaxID=7398 RepID=A0A1B0A8Z3_GLOPL
MLTFWYPFELYDGPPGLQKDFVMNSLPLAQSWNGRHHQTIEPIPILHNYRPRAGPHINSPTANVRCKLTAKGGVTVTVDSVDDDDDNGDICMILFALLSISSVEFISTCVEAFMDDFKRFLVCFNDCCCGDVLLCIADVGACDKGNVGLVVLAKRQRAAYKRCEKKRKTQAERTAATCLLNYNFLLHTNTIDK